MTPVYISLGDSILLNDMENYPEAPRAEVEDFQESNSSIEKDIEKIEGENGIFLEDGQLGEYGVEDNIDGEIYIDYYVPVGNYAVINLSSPCKVYVIDNDSDEPVDTIELIKKGGDQLQIAENQHIELTMYAKVVLQPMK